MLGRTSECFRLILRTMTLPLNAQLQAPQKLVVLVFWGQWNRGNTQKFRRRRSPESMRRHIAADHGTSPDHCAFTDCDIGQNDTMRPDEDILFNHYFSITRCSSGTGIKMGDYRRSYTNCAVVANSDVHRMYLIDVHSLANPNILSDHDSAKTLQPRSHAESAGRHQSYPSSEPTE